ncbi:hypothetical protein AB0I82_00135 [Streptomyces sp. NPDC050315]|uniref:hypothetical protein n=1 Tax=Streptomyces sp. NPDC050315 TaxID=3155039 RepID=UPI0034466088
MLLVHDQERTLLRSGHGTDLTAAFPELVAAAAELPNDVVLDGEVIIWADGRLAFEYRTRRLSRRPAAAARLAEQHPAHFVFSVKSYMLKDYGSPRLFELRKQSGHSRYGTVLGAP